MGVELDNAMRFLGLEDDPDSSSAVGLSERARFLTKKELDVFGCLPLLLRGGIGWVG